MSKQPTNGFRVYAILCALACLATPAAAGNPPVPAPIVGAGLPLLLLLGGGYWVVRKLRQRSRKK
jgi:hypothetical protein